MTIVDQLMSTVMIQKMITEEPRQLMLHQDPQSGQKLILMKIQAIALMVKRTICYAHAVLSEWCAYQ